MRIMFSLKFLICSCYLRFLLFVFFLQPEVKNFKYLVQLQSCATDINVGLNMPPNKEERQTDALTNDNKSRRSI